MPNEQAKSSSAAKKLPTRSTQDFTGRAATRRGQLAQILAALLLLSSGVGAGKLRPGLRPVPYKRWSQGYRPTGFFTTAEGPDSSFYFFSLDGLSKLDVDTGECHRIEPIGSVRPDTRMFHAMCAVGADIYVHAGITMTTGGDHTACYACIALASFCCLTAKSGDFGMLQYRCF